MMNQMAYIDPATTALVIQIIAGLFITVGVVFGTWWTKFTTFIRGIWVKIFGGQDKEAMSREEEEAMREVEGILDDETAENSKLIKNDEVTEFVKPLKQRKKILSNGGGAR